MPIYLPSLNGVSLSEALADAAVHAPISRIVYGTYELWHPAFTQAARIVNNHEDVTATLEATAPRNPSSAVLFKALPIVVKGPGESDEGAAPMIEISIDGVSQELVEQLDLALESLVPIELIERIYTSDDLTAPALMPPLTVVLRECEVNEMRVTAKATFADPANRPFPRKDYTRAEYPGLAAR